MNNETSGSRHIQNKHQNTFKEVVVTLSDGNEIAMNKCLNCGFVTRQNSFTKLAHWRHCPSKWLFKYVNQNCGKRSYTAICMACGTQIKGTSTVAMSEHYAKCTAVRQNDTIADMNSMDPDTEFGETITIDGIEYIPENAVSQCEMDGQLKLQGHQLNLLSRSLTDGFLFKYSAGPNGLVRQAECQQCLKRVRRPFNVKLATHRKICPLGSQVLLAVSTQPNSSQNNLSLFDTTISSSIIDDDATTSVMDNSTMKICFICNTTSSPSYVNLYETVSEHSKTPLFDFVWKFLDDQPTVRDDSIDGANSNWSMLCMRCFNKVNQYDCACVTAARLEQELRDELSQTEAFYSGQQRIDEPNEEEMVYNESNEVQQQEQQQQQQQQQQQEQQKQQANEANEVNQEDGVMYETPVDPLDVPINLDSPPPLIPFDANKEQQEETNDELIELSDDEDVQQAIELSDDE